MIYAISDIHGCYDKYRELLDKIHLRDEDTLYILGDLLDRGPGGMKLILDVMHRDNIVCFRGNHDHEALFHMKRIMKASWRKDIISMTERFANWLSDGGEATYEAFMKLDDTEKKAVVSFMDMMPWFREIEVNGRRFFLSHTVPEKSKFLHFEKCRLYDFIMGEPEYEKEYRSDITIVTGHSPTSYIDPKYRGRIMKQNGHIAIDCGAVYGGRLGGICLDTMEEFYAGNM